MALLEPGDEGYEFRGDRPPDYRVADFNVWDPESNLEQRDTQTIMAGHTALVEAFDSWAAEEFPQARNIGDVVDILDGTFVPPKSQTPHKFELPFGAKWVAPTETDGVQSA